MSLVELNAFFKTYRHYFFRQTKYLHARDEREKKRHLKGALRLWGVLKTQPPLAEFDLTELSAFDRKRAEKEGQKYACLLQPYKKRVYTSFG